MPKFDITLISPERAKAMLTEYKEQRKNSVLAAISCRITN